MSSRQRGTGDGLLLRGLDGSNPLAFLAALGTLRTLSLAWPARSVRMRWTEHSGAFRPLLSATEQLAESEVIDALFSVACHGESGSCREEARAYRNEVLRLEQQIEDEELQLRNRGLKKKAREERLKPLRDRQHRSRTEWLRIAQPQLLLGPDTIVPPKQFRPIEEESARSASSQCRNYADFVAALGTSSFSQDGRIADTALRTMSGAGHQHFLGFMVNLLLSVTPGHLAKALFKLWLYEDPVQNLTMRWDPSDDARYALRWSDPSGDPAREARGSVLGANVLAIMGIPMVPSVPARTGLRTVGFSGRRASDTFWIWPIWEGCIDVATCRSLLAHPAVAELHSNQDPAKRTAARQQLTALGVTQCYRSQRITVGKIRSFTPAEAV